MSAGTDMLLVKGWALTLALVWLSVPLLAWLKWHKSAVIVACVAAAFGALPHLPRTVQWLIDAGAHEARYGASAQPEVMLGLLAMALLAGALCAAVAAWRRPWWLLLSVVLSLPMVLFGVWLAFHFRLFF
jgi:hypothetical protein